MRAFTCVRGRVSADEREGGRGALMPAGRHCSFCLCGWMDQEIIQNQPKGPNERTRSAAALSTNAVRAAFGLPPEEDGR